MSSDEVSAHKQVGRTHIGGVSLEQLRDRYHGELFEDFLPFFNRYGVDHELGGFTCNLDYEGTPRDTTKDMWYQGRGLWTYSYLYNHFGGDENLEVARKTRDFLLRHGRDDNGDWVRQLDREGGVLEGAETRGYAGMFIAEGLQEYAKATGDQESMDLAVDALWRAMAKWDDPDCLVDEGYTPISYPGMRTQGSHMVAILILTQMLEQVSDPKLEVLADRVVDGIMNRFWNPEYRLNNEALDHNYERPDDENEDFIYLGHTLETLWMVLSEAMRRKDRALFDLVAERLQRHMEVAWDDVYGGFHRGMSVHGAYTSDKWNWEHEEVLIGTMLLMEHTDLEWPEAWFGRTYEYAHETFWLKPQGYPLFKSAADRRGTLLPETSSNENYHHPRHLMRNLMALERMIESNGAASGFWG